MYVLGSRARRKGEVSGRCSTALGDHEFIMLEDEEAWAKSKAPVLNALERK